MRGIEETITHRKVSVDNETFGQKPLYDSKAVLIMYFHVHSLNIQNGWMARSGDLRVRQRMIRDRELSLAKQILTDDTEVLYGIFGIIANSHYFPPRKFLNEFFAVGCDPCDQDNRMSTWKPFELTEDEYQQIKKWWQSLYPDAVEDSLGVSNWSDWSVVIIHGPDVLENEA